MVFLRCDDNVYINLDEIMCFKVDRDNKAIVFTMKNLNTYTSTISLEKLDDVIEALKYKQISYLKIYFF